MVSPPLRWQRGGTAPEERVWQCAQGWPGHLSGQHPDVRLTAPDRYTATRPYSIASAAGEPPELTVGQVRGGEVSTFLLNEARPGTPMRLLCSVRDPAAALYRDELLTYAARQLYVDVSWVYT